MFGHNNTDQISQDQQSDAHVQLGDDTINDLTSSAPYLNDHTTQPSSAPAVSDATIQPSQTQASDTTLSTQPITSDESADTHLPAASDELSVPTTVRASEETTETVNTAPVTTPEAHKDLLDIKQEALTSLSPLVHNLELDSEEKFKTLMMLIQASDNHELVQEAYKAAQAIPDEKVRAQALLDVVNEINYFTHGKEDTAN